MKTKTIFNFLLAALVATTFAYAQEIELDVENQVVNVIGDDTSRDFIGTITYDGQSAGTSGVFGTYYGYFAGNLTTGSSNVFLGPLAGRANTVGRQSTFVGQSAGRAFVGTTSHLNNAFFGLNTGWSQQTGSSNTYLGSWAGFRNVSGSRNTFVGQSNGFNVLGSGNVMIGYSAGYSETGSNKLYIDNSSSGVPLMYGDFASNKLGINTKQLPNNVGGANTSAYSLYVEGGLLSEEVRVRTGWADYVFDAEYELAPLAEVEAFISSNGHLPNIPSAAQVEAQGIELGDMARLQQEKIEELTLYVIQQQKEIDELKVLVSRLLEQK